jgi:hypothetical protein
MNDTTTAEQLSPTLFAVLAEALREKERPPGLPYFSDIELTQMHNYCLKYRDLVRGGGRPTKEQSTRFMKFQRVCYGEGIAHDE